MTPMETASPSGPKREANGLAGVEADPCAADLTSQGSSIGHAPESLPRMIDARFRICSYRACNVGAKDANCSKL